jgi:hypothetical protein
LQELCAWCIVNLQDLQKVVSARKSSPEALAAARAAEEEAAVLAAQAPVHEDNEWGISVVGTGMMAAVR